MHGTLTTEQRVRGIVADELNCDRDFAWDADLFETLGADSLDRVVLAVRIEDDFNVTVSEDTSDEWRTAGDLLKTVEGLV